MDKGRILLRAVVGLVGTANAAASAMSQNREAEYQEARQAFWATCAESDRLLEAAGTTLTHVSELGPITGAYSLRARANRGG